MDRTASLARLGSEEFDVCVIGGGVTGAGVAFDAVLRGLRVALVERDDFASGTSSKSSKLIHGGLRYLQRLRFRQVHEGLRERRILERMAPHLVRRTQFLFPRFKGWAPLVRAGLTAYDLLSTDYPRHRSISPGVVAQLAPALKPARGAFEYWDARTDDARLVWTIVRSATDRGAAAANYCEVVKLLHVDDRCRGVRVLDRETDTEFDVRARVVINATGVWDDHIHALVEERGSRDVRPSKGIHVVVRASRVPLDCALILPTPDGRFLFAIPWADDTIVVGTTDADYDGPLDDPKAEPKEIEWVLNVLNDALEDPVSESDVVSTFAGLRPLVARRGRPTKDVSRRPLLEVTRSGLVTTTGGKLTSWRPMAAHAVDRALIVGGFEFRPASKTEKERLNGAASEDGVVPALEAVLDDLRLDRTHAQRLYERYGGRSSEVLRLVRVDPSLGSRLHPEAPYLRAEAEYAITAEGARRPSDVIARRLRATITTSDGGRAALEWVCGRLGLHHGWTKERYETEMSAF